MMGKYLHVSFIIPLPEEMLFKLADTLTEKKLVTGEITDFTKKKAPNAKGEGGECVAFKCGEAIKLTRKSRIKCGFNLLSWAWDDNVSIVKGRECVYVCVCVCFL